MDPTIKQLAKVFVDVTYKYVVDEKVFYDVIAYIDNIKVRGNKY